MRMIFKLCEMSLHIINKAESPHESSSEAENTEDEEEQEEKPKKKHKTTAELLKEEILRMSGVNPSKCMRCGKCSATQIDLQVSYGNCPLLSPRIRTPMLYQK